MVFSGHFSSWLPQLGLLAVQAPYVISYDVRIASTERSYAALPLMYDFLPGGLVAWRAENAVVERDAIDFRYEWVVSTGRPVGVTLSYAERVGSAAVTIYDTTVSLIELLVVSPMQQQS